MVHIVEIDDSTERHDDLADIDDNISDGTSEAESEDEPGEEADATSMPSELKTLSGLSGLTLDGAASLSTAAVSDWLTLVASFGESGTDLGQFDQPWGITFLPTGDLCIAERGGPRLQVISDAFGFASCGMDARVNASHCKAISLPAGAVDDVQDIYCDGEALFVADMGNHCVHHLALPDGTALSAIRGEKAQEMSYPRAIATERRERGANEPAVGPQLPEQLLFICDSGNGRILAYDTATFAHVRSIGRQSDPHTADFVEGELALPLGVCAHRGDIYVVDGHKHRISVFKASSGAFLRSIGGPGSKPGQLKSPFGALVVRGMLVVTEATRVQVMTLDGVPRLTLEIPGAQNLSGLTADDDETCVYVCDTSRGCVYALAVNWSDEGDRFAEMLNE